MKPTTFYIVRHGQTVWNVAMRLQGHLDSPLTSKGVKQAQELAQKFVSLRLDAIFASDVGRARRTAEIIAAGRQLQVETTELLREGYFGKYEGRPVEEFLTELAGEIDARQQLATKEYLEYGLSPEVESGAAMVRRFMRFLDDKSQTYQGKSALVVSHGAMMRMLLIHLGFGTHKELGARCIANLAYIKLVVTKEGYSIVETQGITKA